MSGPSTSTSGSTMSSTLWAHLLNKEATASGPGLHTGLASLGLAASAPADKAGTSVRILLHDTQATMEKLGERVDKLLSEAMDSRQKLLARNEEVNDEVGRLVRRVIQEQAGRTETALRSCIGGPAQAPSLAELRQSTSSSLDALNQKVDAIQNALQTIKDQQMQILTAIIPLLPTLQKVPLHIASTEANLKEAIRKSLVVHTIGSAQSTSSRSASGSKKRKLSKIGEQLTPSPSVTKRKRLRIDSSFVGQQQLPSPKVSRDSLFAQGGLPSVNYHRTIGDALHSSSRLTSSPVNAVQIPNPSQRLSMQPPTPSHSRMRESSFDASVPPFVAQPVSSTRSPTPVSSHRLNHSKDVFKLPTQFHIHTPTRTGSRHLNDQSMRPPARPPSSVGLSVRRGRRFIPITYNDDDDDEISDN